MSFPFEYDHGAPLAFGGALPRPKDFADSRVVILPVPVDRTTSYVPGTRNGPREILQASSHMELWDEELGADPSTLHDLCDAIDVNDAIDELANFFGINEHENP